MPNIEEVLIKIDAEEKEIQKEIEYCEFIQEHSLIEEDVFNASIDLVKLESAQKVYKHIKNLLKEGD